MSNSNAGPASMPSLTMMMTTTAAATVITTPDPAPQLPHETSISTVCFSGCLAEKLEAISEAGFTTVELYEDDLLHYPGTVSEIRELCTRFGLRIGSFRAHLEFRKAVGGDGDGDGSGSDCGSSGGTGIATDEVEVVLRRECRRLESKFRWMDELGTDLLLLSSNPSTINDTRDLNRLVSNIRSFGALAEQYKKRIAFNPICWAPGVNHWGQVWDLMKTTSHPSIGLCLDTFHIFAHPEYNSFSSDPGINVGALLRTLSQLKQIDPSKIFSVQLSDSTLLPNISSAKEVGLHHRSFPLQGRFPLTEFLRAVASTGYKGPITLEVFSDDYRAAPSTRVALDGRRSVLLLLSEVYDKPQIQGEDVVMEDGVGIQGIAEVLPPVGEVLGFEWTEFVIDEGRVEILGRWLEGLGMRRVAKHKCSKVWLYGNGNVYLGVNAEWDSQAKTCYQSHGLSVSSIGVRVRDPAPILKRAKRLHYELFEIPREGDQCREKELMAIRAPDGSSVVLVSDDSHWKDDFDWNFFAADNSTAPSYYSGIDHIAQAVDRLMMDAFVMFHKGVFGLTSQELWHMNDPYGITKSRAMVSNCPVAKCENEASGITYDAKGLRKAFYDGVHRDNFPSVGCGGLKFPLNITDQSDTHIGRLVQLASGSIVCSVALATDDIFSTMRSMRSKTKSSVYNFLRIPPNYYADIATRYDDLPAQFIDMMRKNDIMFDRNEKGDFLHTSTGQFEDRFFIEVVMRVGCYDKFGSVNAPLRMSVHHERRLVNRKIKNTLWTGDLEGGRTPTDGSPAGWSHKRIKTVAGENGVEQPAKATMILVVFGEAKEQLLDLIGNVLGVKATIVENKHELRDAEQSLREPLLVVGVSQTTFLRDFKEGWERDRCSSPSFLGANDKILLYTLCVDLGEPPVDEGLSELCDYEYYYTVDAFTRRDLVRFLSLILGQSTSHDEIVSKTRSHYLILTYPDIRVALPDIPIMTVGTDAVEIRIDLLKDKNSNGIPGIRYVGEQLMLLRQRTKLPVVFTLRSIVEGGRFPLEQDGPEKAYSYLRKGIQWGCEYVDVEIRLPSEIRSRIHERKRNTKIMCSHHSMSGKFPWSSPEVESLYQSGREYGDIVKIAGFANSLEDNFELERFRSYLHSREVSEAGFRSTIPPSPSPLLLAYNAGQFGQLSRVLNPFMSPVTHDLLPTSAAPGQITVADVNSALHIIGQLPKREIVSIISDISIPSLAGMIPPEMTTTGLGHASSSTTFMEKCFRELGLPHKCTSIELDTLSENAIKSFLHQPSFGGATITPPLLGPPSYLPSVSGAAKRIGAVDTIFVRTVGNESTFVGDNVAWKGVRDTLLRDFTKAAYKGQSALVVAQGPDEARPVVYALRGLGIGKIWTVGFRWEPLASEKLRTEAKKTTETGSSTFGGVSGKTEGSSIRDEAEKNCDEAALFEQFTGFGEMQKVRQPFVVVSCLPVEQGRTVFALLKKMASFDETALSSSSSPSVTGETAEASMGNGVDPRLNVPQPTSRPGSGHVPCDMIKKKKIRGVFVEVSSCYPRPQFQGHNNNDYPSPPPPANPSNTPAPGSDASNTNGTLVFPTVQHQLQFYNHGRANSVGMISTTEIQWAHKAGWIMYGNTVVQGWKMVETLKVLVGQNVAYEFVEGMGGMVIGRGIGRGI